MDFDINALKNENSIYAYFEEICNRKPSIDSILIYGTNNMNYSYNMFKTWNPNYNAKNEEWYQKTVAGEEKWVLSQRRRENQLYTLVYSNFTASREVITFSRVIRDKANFRELGVLAINISVDAVDNIGKSTGAEGLIAVVDSGGNIIMGELPQNKGDYIGISLHSNITGWEIQYFTSIKDLLKEMIGMRNITIMIFILTIIVALILVNLLSLEITSPLNLLKGRMKRVSMGEFQGIIYTKRNSEISEIIDGFNIMVGRIGQLIEEIHHKEEQRLKTELYAIQASINPHFIYNTLNGIRCIPIFPISAGFL